MTKRPNNVIEPLRKREIIVFYIKSVFVGLIVVLKWIISFLWSYVYNKKKNPTCDKDDGNIHDKPPICLMDTNIGRHSYVKLKVIEKKILDYCVNVQLCGIGSEKKSNLMTF